MTVAISVVLTVVPWDALEVVKTAGLMGFLPAGQWGGGWAAGMAFP